MLRGAVALVTGTLGLACASPKNCVLVQEDADFAYIQTTTDGFATVATTLVDAAEGAALVEASVDGAGCFVVVGGAVSGGGQSSASYHSCDQGLTWEADALADFPFDLLFTDIDCGAGVNASCWATLCASNGPRAGVQGPLGTHLPRPPYTTLSDAGDDSGVDPNGYVAKYN